MGLWMGGFDVDRSSHQDGSVQLSYRVVRFPFGSELDKPKTSGSRGFSIHEDLTVLSPIGGKKVVHFFFGQVPIQVRNKQSHVSPKSPKGIKTSSRYPSGGKEVRGDLILFERFPSNPRWKDAAKESLTDPLGFTKHPHSEGSSNDVEDRDRDKPGKKETDRENLIGLVGDFMKVRNQVE